MRVYEGKMYGKGIRRQLVNWINRASEYWTMRVESGRTESAERECHNGEGQRHFCHSHPLYSSS